MRLWQIHLSSEPAIDREPPRSALRLLTLAEPIPIPVDAHHPPDATMQEEVAIKAP